MTIFKLKSIIPRGVKFNVALVLLSFLPLLQACFSDGSSQGGGYSPLASNNQQYPQTTVVEVMCEKCYGNGTCPVCNGSGFDFYGDLCYNCGGFPKCGACGGSGRNSVTRTMNADGSIDEYNANTGRQTHLPNPMNPNPSPNQNSQSNRNSSDRSCWLCGGTGDCCDVSATMSTQMEHYCNGTGRCGKCGGDGWMSNTYTGENMLCTFCAPGQPGVCGKCGGSRKCHICNGSGRLK